MHWILKEFTLKASLQNKNKNKNLTPAHLQTSEHLQGITKIYKKAAASLRPKWHLCKTAIMKHFHC